MKKLRKYFVKNLKKMFKDIMSKDKKRFKRQFANLLTLIRGVLAPTLIVVSLIINSLTMSFVVIILSILTDRIDGWYARKYGYVSEFGALLDAICDKVFTFCVILPIIFINIYLFAIIIFIEILISLTNFYLKMKGKEYSSRSLGKIKTIILDLTLIVCYMSRIFTLPYCLVQCWLISTILFQLIALVDYQIRLVRQIR